MTDQVDPNAAAAGEPMPNETLYEKAAELLHSAETAVENLLHPVAPPAGAATDLPVSAEPQAGSWTDPKIAERVGILDDLEREAEFWGGDGLSNLRRYIGRLRASLGL